MNTQNNEYRDNQDTEPIAPASNDNKKVSLEDHMQQEVGWGIDKGKVRETNEDSLAAVTLSQASDEGNQSIGVYAVADGMGGQQAGEVASKLAVRTVLRKLMAEVTQTEENMPGHYHDWLDAAVKLANDVVRNKAKEESNNMGTTLVIALVVGQKVHVVNVGDSRAYLVNAEGIHRITKDHSLVQGLIDNGVIKPEEAKKHPYRNILTEAVGTHDEVKSDLFHTMLNEKESLLLCSDGVWDMLSEDQIWQIVYNAATPDEACQTLIDSTNAAGGRDNIAAVVIRLNNDGSFTAANQNIVR